MYNLDTWASLHPSVNNIKDDLRAWLEKYGDALEDHREELVHHVCDYVYKSARKKEVKILREGSNEDTRETKSLGYAKKLREELLKAPTPRGEKLIGILDELVLAPEIYIYKPNTVEVNQDVIRSRLKKYCLRIDAREALYKII